MMIDPNKFFEKFDTLPSSLQDLLSSDKLPRSLEDILEVTNIDLKYYEPIMESIEEILLLEKDMDSLEKEIQSKTNLPSSQVQLLADLIKKQIFSPVENDLKSFSQTDILKNLRINQEIPNEKPKEEENYPFDLLKPENEKLNKENLSQFPPLQERKKDSLEKREGVKSQIEEPLSQQIPSQKEKIFPKDSQNIENNIENMENIKISNLQIPEPQPIIIEKPLDKTKELKRIKLAEVSSKEKEKIKEKLLKIMTEKKSSASPEILKKMKEVSQKKIQEEKPPEKKEEIQMPKITYFEKQKEPASFTIESTEKFIPEEETESKKESQKEIPSIIGAKIKEFKKKNKF